MKAVFKAKKNNHRKAKLNKTHDAKAITKKAVYILQLFSRKLDYQTTAESVFLGIERNEPLTDD